MARIQMTINNYDKSKLKTAESSDPDEARDDEEEDETPVDPQTTDHWTFGAPFPGRLMNSRAVEEMEGGSRPFANFDLRLRTFISTSWPEEGIKFEDMITVRASSFQSLSTNLFTDTTLQVRSYHVPIPGGLARCTRYHQMQPSLPSTPPIRQFTRQYDRPRPAFCARSCSISVQPAKWTACRYCPHWYV